MHAWTLMLQANLSAGFSVKLGDHVTVAGEKWLCFPNFSGNELLSTFLLAQKKRIESGEKRLTSSLDRPSLAILCAQHIIGIYQHDAELALRNTYYIAKWTHHLNLSSLSPLCFWSTYLYNFWHLYPWCPFPFVSSLLCLFLWDITILWSKKCRYLTILALLLLWHTSCLCTLSSIPSIPLRTTIPYRNFSLSCSTDSFCDICLWLPLILRRYEII